MTDIDGDDLTCCARGGALSAYKTVLAMLEPHRDRHPRARGGFAMVMS